MMRNLQYFPALLLLCILNFLAYPSANAQWTNLGSFRHINMVANAVGHRLEVGWTGNTFGGGTWRLFHTNDDWSTMEYRAGDPTGGNTCCYPNGFVAYNDIIFIAIRDGGTYYPYRSTDGGYSIAPFGGTYNDFVVWEQAYSADEWYLAAKPYNSNTTLKVFKQISNQRIMLLEDERYDGTKARLEKVSDNLLFVSAIDTTGIVRLLRTTNEGATWTNPLSVGLGDYLAIDFPNDQVGYVGGSNGTCYKTVDGGLTWNSLFLNGPVNVGAIDFLNSDTGFVSTKEGLMLTTLNGGQTWTSELVDSTANFSKLQAISMDAIYLHATTWALYKRGPVITSSEAFSESLAQMQIVPNGQQHGYKIVLPESWTMQQWQIFDLRGGLLDQGSSDQLSLEGMPAGVYLVRVATNKGMQSLKISKN
jgi:hypothetical protein